MSKEKLWKLAIVFAVAAILWFIPPPQGLTVEVWRLFAIYVSAIVGVVLKPYNEPVIILTAIAASSLLLNNTKAVLAGYSSTSTWLVFSAFGISAAFVSTGLGKRIAYFLIEKMGSTTLRLGYVTAILDGFLAPATPSNTARAGGIVFPIMNSVSLALGSEPGKTPEKAGAYFMVNTYMVTKVTSFMFLTGMGGNALAAEFMAQMTGVKLDWVAWANALFVPGLVLLLLTPYLVYLLEKPTVQKVDNKAIAKAGLETLGPMTIKEKLLLVVFVLALLGWGLPAIAGLIGIKLKFDATAVAVGALALLLVSNVLTWEDLLKNKGGWQTLIWFGGIIGLAGALAKAKFFDWVGNTLQANLSFGDATLALWGLMFISIIVRYIFASATAFIAALIPVFLMLGLSAGINPVVLCLLLAASNSYGGALTHYGGPAAPIIFGAGYNTTKKWWIVGGLFAVMCYLVMMLFGPIWWKIIGII